MKKVALETIGCRLNQYDTEKIALILQNHGFERVDFSDSADLYIINTCTVTGRADASCRNIISRAARQEHRPPVVVIGCYVDSDPAKVASLNGVDLVVHNRDKDSIINILQNKFPTLFNDYHGESFSGVLSEFHQHNRAWIKIGDGCNQKCSYCIIPEVRGALVNVPPEKIVDEVNALSLNGYREVVLTGVHIGMYKYEKVNSIGQLLRYILKNSDIARIRLSSIEPQEVDDELIDVVAGSNRRICRHLHLPMQSGSDRILKLMRRPYNVEQYLEKVRLVKEKIDHGVLGADIIVGFDYLHVFSYSDRPGTDASKMHEKIKPDIIKERNSILRSISDINYSKRLRQEIGQKADLISEFGKDNLGRFWGISDNYLKSIIPEGHGGGREIISITVTDVANGRISGELIS